MVRVHVGLLQSLQCAADLLRTYGPVALPDVLGSLGMAEISMFASELRRTDCLPWAANSLLAHMCCRVVLPAARSFMCSKRRWRAEAQLWPHGNSQLYTSDVAIGVHPNVAASIF